MKGNKRMNSRNTLAAGNATDKVERLERALSALEQHDDDAGDGKWLETLVEDVATLIQEWDIEAIHPWADWPEREEVLGEEVGPEDIGIDLVGRRKGRRWIAIQCKGKGRGNDGTRRRLTKDDVQSFLSAIGSDEWAGRWIVSNADPTRNSANLGHALQTHEVSFVEIAGPVRREHERRKTAAQDPRSEMQADAVQQILKKLEDIRGERHEKWEPDEARAQAIMPCGTGKTRVGFQVASSLVGNGGLVIVMAPSIGLVRQLQGDWRALANETGMMIATLAVCSDATAGGAMDARTEDAQAESEGMDPTIDRGLVRTRELTGEVAQSAEKVAEWIQKRTSRKGLQVIMSTYQSGHHTGEGLRIAAARADLMIADEAHRTAGIRVVKGKAREKRLRQFTACHDNRLIPGKNRLYMTATPRVFNIEEKPNAKADDYIVAPMHREAIFGPVAYRLSYLAAVEKGFLSDYRIVAVALPGSAHDAANEMAEKQGERGRTGKDRSTSLALRKLAYGLALAGGVPVRPEDGGVMPLESSIAFLNRVQSSKDMAAELDEEIARKWIGDHLAAQSPPMTAKRFSLEHRDASHGAAVREEALTKLKTATADAPAGVTNVGIFGEGIDTPSLSGVAFVEARRSPIDVIQAVGRAMRLSPNKRFGIILIPIEIPPGYDAEAWLESRPNLDGWKELGQILQALRAHDGRIEDQLADLMDLYVLDGDDDEEGTDLVAIKERSGTKVFLWTGPKGQIENILDPTYGDGRESATKRLSKHGELTPVDETETMTQPTRATYGIDDRTKRNRQFAAIDVEDKWKVTDKGYPTAPPAEKAKETLDAWSRIGRKKGRESPLRKPKRRKRDTKEESRQMGFRLLRELGDDEGRGERIRITLLEKSGLRRGPERDVNILRNTVEYAASRLRDDELEDGLKAQLGMTNLAPPKQGKHRADACTVMALLVLTAAIVHGRLEAGGALRGRRIPGLEEAGTTPEALMSAWDDVLDVDYQPIFKEARNLIRHITRRERKTAGLNEAVRRIVSDALEIGETYAHMEMDHAGQLFNEVMGDQAADGAYFTRPHAAVMLGGLAVEALRRGRLEHKGDVGPGAGVRPDMRERNIAHSLSHGRESEGAKTRSGTREGAGAAQTRSGANADGAGREPGLTAARRSADDPRRPSRAIRQDELGEARIRLPGRGRTRVSGKLGAPHRQSNRRNAERTRTEKLGPELPSRRKGAEPVDHGWRAIRTRGTQRRGGEADGPACRPDESALRDKGQTGGQIRNRGAKGGTSTYRRGANVARGYESGDERHHGQNDRRAAVGRTGPEGNRPGRRRTRNGRTDDRTAGTERPTRTTDIGATTAHPMGDHVTRDWEPKHEPDGRRRHQRKLGNRNPQGPPRGRANEVHQLGPATAQPTGGGRSRRGNRARQCNPVGTRAPCVQGENESRRLERSRLAEQPARRSGRPAQRLARAESDEGNRRSDHARAERRVAGQASRERGR